MSLSVKWIDGIPRAFAARTHIAFREESATSAFG